MGNLIGGTTRPSNTVKVALCSLFAVMVIATAIVGLSMFGGSSQGSLAGIDALKEIGVGLASLGSVATVAKGGRDAAKDLSDGWASARMTAADLPPPRRVPLPPPQDDGPPTMPGPPRPRRRRDGDDVPLPDED